MTEPWRDRPEPWWLTPSPWTCRCGSIFGLDEWERHLRPWMDIDITALDPYGSPLCPNCFEARRRMRGPHIVNDSDRPVDISITPAATPLPPDDRDPHRVCQVCQRTPGPKHLRRLPGRHGPTCTVCIDQQAQQAADDRDRYGDQDGRLRTRVRLDQWLRLPPLLQRQMLARRYGIDPASDAWEWVPLPRGGRATRTYTDAVGLPTSGVTTSGDHFDVDIPWCYWRDWKQRPFKHTRPHQPDDDGDNGGGESA